MKKHILSVLIGAAILVSSASAQASPSDIKQLIDGQDYVFEAKSVMPMGGSARQLYSPYLLTITKDSTVADLPYFGKNNTANNDEASTGIHFKSTKFSYSNKPGKKSWAISIQVKDDGDGSQLYLRIYGDGSAALDVQSNSKDRISYNGFIRSR